MHQNLFVVFAVIRVASVVINLILLVHFVATAEEHRDDDGDADEGGDAVDWQGTLEVGHTGNEVAQ